jgi:hypothetical protein
LEGHKEEFAQNIITGRSDTKRQSTRKILKKDKNDRHEMLEKIWRTKSSLVIEVAWLCKLNDLGKTKCDTAGPGKNDDLFPSLDQTG